MGKAASTTCTAFSSSCRQAAWLIPFFFVLWTFFLLEVTAINGRPDAAYVPVQFFFFNQKGVDVLLLYLLGRPQTPTTCKNQDFNTHPRPSCFASRLPVGLSAETCPPSVTRAEPRRAPVLNVESVGTTNHRSMVISAMQSPENTRTRLIDITLAIPTPILPNYMLCRLCSGLQVDLGEDIFVNPSNRRMPAPPRPPPRAWKCLNRKLD